MWRKNCLIFFWSDEQRIIRTSYMFLKNICVCRHATQLDRNAGIHKTSIVLKWLPCKSSEKKMCTRIGRAWAAFIHRSYHKMFAPFIHIHLASARLLKWKTIKSLVALKYALALQFEHVSCFFIAFTYSHSNAQIFVKWIQHFLHFIVEFLVFPLVGVKVLKTQKQWLIADNAHSKLCVHSTHVESAMIQPWNYYKTLWTIENDV